MAAAFDGGTGPVKRLTRAVRVRPGASATRVGGSYGEGESRALVVRVHAPAVDGRATDAVLEAVARALGIPGRRIGLLSGATSRTKVLWIEVDSSSAGAIEALWTDLLEA